MAFEILTKKTNRVVLEGNMLRINKYSVVFSPQLIEKMDNMPYIEIHLDKARNLMGFRGTHSKVTGFKVQKHVEDLYRRIASTQIAELSERGIYFAELDDDIWAIQIKKPIAKI